MLLRCCKQGCERAGILPGCRSHDSVAEWLKGIDYMLTAYARCCIVAPVHAHLPHPV